MCGIIDVPKREPDTVRLKACYFPLQRRGFGVVPHIEYPDLGAGFLKGIRDIYCPDREYRLRERLSISRDQKNPHLTFTPMAG